MHLPAPKRIDRPNYQVTIPNEMYQFDLLYMPSDTLYGNKYKYILAGIDAASRFKVARPLRTKQARDVAEMIADIYKVGPLTYPKIFQCDNEFFLEEILFLGTYPSFFFKGLLFLGKNSRKEERFFLLIFF